MRHVFFAGAIVLVVVAGVLAVGSPAFAQILKYVDERGVTHYAGSEDQVPEWYRDRAIEPILPEVVRAADHTGSLRALADATIRLHSLRARDVDDGGKATAGDNARLRQAYVAREAARAQYIARRTQKANQKGCRFNPNTMQDDCSGAAFRDLASSTRGTLSAGTLSGGALSDRGRILR